MRFAMLGLLLLAGCATSPQDPDVAAARASWTGATYDQVVTQWGTPVRSTTLSPDRYAYTWVSEQVEPRAAIFPSLGIFGGSGHFGFGTGVTVGAGGGGELVRCERTLIFEKGRVVDQTWQSSGDYCGRFGRR
jgi:hypothetical protein